MEFTPEIILFKLTKNLSIRVYMAPKVDLKKTNLKEIVSIFLVYIFFCFSLAKFIVVFNHLCCMQHKNLNDIFLGSKLKIHFSTIKSYLSKK